MATKETNPAEVRVATSKLLKANAFAAPLVAFDPTGRTTVV